MPKGFVTKQSNNLTEKNLRYLHCLTVKWQVPVSVLNWLHKNMKNWQPRGERERELNYLQLVWGGCEAYVSCFYPTQWVVKRAGKKIGQEVTSKTCKNQLWGGIFFYLKPLSLIPVRWIRMIFFRIRTSDFGPPGPDPIYCRLKFLETLIFLPEL